MKDQDFAKVYKGDFLCHWDKLARCRKPVIAAVNGYAVRLLYCDCLGIIQQVFLNHFS